MMILDQRPHLAASTDAASSSETFRLKVDGGTMGSYPDGDITVGYALTPGYETYKGMGWYGCLVQRMDGAGA